MYKCQYYHAIGVVVLKKSLTKEKRNTFMDNVKKIILLRCGELMLKKQNRRFFENKLVKNVKYALSGLGDAKVINSRGRVYVEPSNDDFEFDKAIEKLSKVFGIVSLSPVLKIESNFEKIKELALEMVSKMVEGKEHVTFKVETRRANKAFPIPSLEISSKLGEYLLNNIPALKVNVINPSFIFYVEIREHTYLYLDMIPGGCGLPVGTNEKSILLLSGGIDSPVAGWMLMKRGVEIEAVHFYSYPYTSERALEKVIDLTKILTEYCQEIKLHIVPFTKIQTAINENCPEDESTIIMRRFMMKIAERIAKSTGALSLITGESVGQVASQTMHSLFVTDSAVNCPVFRPLIGMDKNEVVEIARRIGTFDTSILPYEDCCTVFVPKHPKTKPILERIMKSESVLDVDGLIEEAIMNTEIKKLP